MQSVLKSLQVLEAVARYQPARVGQLAAQLGISKSTVQRCLRTLAEAGWITETADETTHWTLSNHARFVLSSSQAETGLREAALPIMRRLRDETGETVHLSIPGPGHTSVVIERAESRQQLLTTAAIGSAYPDIITASGIAILAHADAQAVGISVADYRRSAQAADFEERQLLADLAATRRDGYSVRPSATGEMVGVGAAVLESGVPVAGLAILVPTSRFEKTGREALGAAVVAAAAEIEEALRR
ncbi:IclR family transcriptional regulator [Sinomonas sp. G460-2]|uniref:IclR family transcriptional regulator n=1 Tax=Sinomonas sp. G460-2 TaxID=3393464 RepID=UPI0039F07AD3